MAERIQLKEPGTFYARPIGKYRQSNVSIINGFGIVELTKGAVAKIDAQFAPVVSHFGWCYSHGYGMRGKGRHQGPRIYLHQFILDLAGISRDQGEVDHINRNPLDCRLENLRVTSHAVNQVNRGLQSNNSSGYRGVYFCKNRSTDPWMAALKRNGKQQHLGYFPTAESAATAYQEAADALL